MSIVVLWNCHLKVYKSCCNSKGNRVIFKDFFERFENRLWAIQLRIFCKNNPPTSGRGCNFLTSNILFSIHRSEAGGICQYWDGLICVVGKWWKFVVSKKSNRDVVVRLLLDILRSDHELSCDNLHQFSFWSSFRTWSTHQLQFYEFLANPDTNFTALIDYDATTEVLANS